MPSIRALPSNSYTNDMRRLRSFSIACLVVACQVGAWAAPAALPLELWVGAYPSDRLGPQRQSIWRAAWLQQPLKATLPAGEYRLLQRFKVESKIEKIQGFLVFQNCLAHACNSDLATIFFDIGQKKLWVAMAHRDDRRLTVRWYSSGDSYSKLPAQVQTKFTERLGS